MSAIEARPSMTVAQLCDAIDRFICDQRHSRDVSERWFASYLAEPLRIARQVRNSRIDPDFRKLVNDFRCGEIEKERDDKQREINVLEREAQQLHSMSAAQKDGE